MTVRSLLTSSDLSGDLNKFVRINTSGKLELNTAPGTASAGVLVVTYSDGAQQWGIVADGPDIRQVLAGGAFSVTQKLSNDATARAVKNSDLAGSVIQGVAITAAAAAGDLAEIQPFSTSAGASGGASGLLVSTAVSGTANTAGTAASMIPAAARVVIPSRSFFKEGQVLRIRAAGRISSVITTPGTARYDVRLGATVVFDGLAALLDSVAAHVNVGWTLDLYLVLASTGGTASFYGAGVWSTEDLLGVPATAPKGNLVAELPWNTNPTQGNQFDATTALVLDVFFTQTVASGSHTCNMYSAWLDTQSQSISPI